METKTLQLNVKQQNNLFYTLFPFDIYMNIVDKIQQSF